MSLISESTCMSFPLVGNLSDISLSERYQKDSGQAGMTVLGSICHKCGFTYEFPKLNIEVYKE